MGARRFGIGTAVLVLFVGVAFAVIRPVALQSSAKIVLVPVTNHHSTLPSILDGYDSSGAGGSRVELLGSADTLAAAGNPALDLTVRAIPDTRVIDLEATGSTADVQADLGRVMEAARTDAPEIDDLWRMETLQSPSVPVAAPPTDLMVLAATILLAALFGVMAMLAHRSLFGEE
ncbi:MAG: hypothetical protein QOG62_1303 [Thermoleophilaceae bacterium]|jgi:hypothetical protein|nr:hypothetical protein [Thermoleophilaceae bacterium]